MRRNIKRGFALLLATSVLWASVGTVGSAEEPAQDIEAIEEGNEAQSSTEGIPQGDGNVIVDDSSEEAAVPQTDGEALTVSPADEEVKEENITETAMEDIVVTYSMDASLFYDVSSSDWFHPYVSWVLSKSIMTGKGDNKFAPSEDLSRAQFVTVLYRMSGSPEVPYDARFPDSPQGTFFSNAVSWAVQEDVQVITGYDDGKLGSSDPITREQMATMLYRYAEYKKLPVTEPGELGKFPDATAVSDFAKTAMEWAVGAGIISGDQGKLNPQGTTSRAVCATMISRFAEKFMPGQFPDVDITASCGTVEANTLDKELGTFWVKIHDLQGTSGVSKARVAVWCASDQSDLVWYDAVRQGDGLYGVEVDPARHQYHTGTYQIHVYAALNNGLHLYVAERTTEVSVAEIPAKIYRLRNQVYDQVGRDLYACFNWSVMRYYAQGNNVPAGYTPSQWYSIYGLENQIGDCQVMAATFYQLAKGLGYDARYLQGYVPLAGGGVGDHGWVEIVMDGTTYVFDPDFQSETGRNGYQITYGASGTWRYGGHTVVD